MPLTLATQTNKYTSIKRASDNQSQDEITPEVSDVNELVSATKEPIYSCTTIFPFTFFPDTITVDKNKIDIVYSNFFFSKSIFTIMLEDIRTVKINTDLLFGTMLFELVGYEKNPEPVNFLPKSKALKMRRIIMGLTTARREEIEMHDFDKLRLRRKAEKIGLEQEKATGV